jgi:hypothetical protein
MALEKRLKAERKVRADSSRVSRSTAFQREEVAKTCRILLKTSWVPVGVMSLLGQRLCFESLLAPLWQPDRHVQVAGSNMHGGRSAAP